MNSPAQITSFHDGMADHRSPSTSRQGHVAGVGEKPARGRRWTGAIAAAFPLAVLMAMASLGGILIPSLYVRESTNWAAQAVGQDWMDLLLAVPWLTATGLFAWRGSPRALSLLAGGLLYTVYTFVIYALGMHFNAMFLIYCAALGISLFALGGVLGIISEGSTVPPATRPAKTAGYFLVALGVLFSVAWLSEILPALFWNTVPPTIAEAETLTNPVYVMDLAVILPLHLVTGIALLRRRPLGLLFAPVVLAFGALMALSIAGMMVVMRLRGAEASLGVAGGMTTIGLAAGAVLWLLLRSTSRRPTSPCPTLWSSGS
jgi:hypothetical protein